MRQREQNRYATAMLSLAGLIIAMPIVGLTLAALCA